MTNQKEGRMKIEERDEKPNGDKKKEHPVRDAL